MTGNLPASQQVEISRPITPDSQRIVNTSEAQSELPPSVMIVTSDWTLCTQTSMKMRFDLLGWVRSTLKRFRLGS